MAIAMRSFAKINIGLAIGPLRDDKFHELRTVYQTIALHDVVKVDAQRGSGIEIRCKDQRVPDDETNTCYRVADRMLRMMKHRARVVIQIEKKLPVQGGLGAGSSNAIATMLGLERVLKRAMEPRERLRIAAEVGSDLPLFLVGGTVLGVGRGEMVYPLDELPLLNLVVVTPEKSVSTPEAFEAWDKLHGGERDRYGNRKARRSGDAETLTENGNSTTINSFSQSVASWLCGTFDTATGVPARSAAQAAQDKSRDRAEALLLDLVRTGIENDFEQVVFSQHPVLRDVKRALEHEKARYVSLTGSGAAVYGLFDSAAAAEAAAGRLEGNGFPAQATTTLSRREYWKRVFS